MLKPEAVAQKIEEVNMLNFLRDKHAASYKVQTLKGEEQILLNKDACISVLKDVLKNDKAVDEFTKEGFGKEIVETLEEHTYYSAASLINWEYVIRNNFEALNALGKWLRNSFVNLCFSFRIRRSHSHRAVRSEIQVQSAKRRQISGILLQSDGDD